MAHPEPVERAIEQLARQLAATYRGALDEIRAEAAAVADGIEANPRLWRRRDRLAELELRVGATLDRIDEIAEEFVTRNLPTLYEAGGRAASDVVGDVFGWTQPHYDAVTLLAADLHGELLEATTHVRLSVKRTIRRVVASRSRSGRVLGRTALRSADEVANLLRGRGIGSVVYANGRRVWIDTYAEMAMRTKTGVAYNAGLLGQSHALGVGWIEVFDGADCGWSHHEDGDRANGTVRPIAECNKTPLSHPNCRRSFGPRPDVTNARQAADAALSQSADAMIDQRVWEGLLDLSGPGGAAKRAARARTAETRAARAMTPGQTARNRPTRARLARERQAGR